MMPDRSTLDRLIVLGKAPIAGQAKTRLARDIGAEHAQVLAEAFVLDTLSLGGLYSDARLIVSYASKEGRSWFRQRARGAELYRQPDGTLGQRIRAAILWAFRSGAERCVVIGTDTPQLEQNTLWTAFNALGTHDVCLGPAADGGYYLIGLRSDQPVLFEDIPWSTDSVCNITLERARENGLSVALLPAESDVDEGPDLEELAKVLRARPGVAPKTRAALERIRQERS